MKTVKMVIFYYFLGLFSTSAQEILQNITGLITDETTGAPVSYAAVAVRSVDSVIGAISGLDGHFIIKNLAVGRYDIEISCLGYEPVLLREVLVISGKEMMVNVSLRETNVSIDEIEVKPRTNKEAPLNKMAMVSARMLSVEEAQRYAGGFDDPARLASSFAGVSGNLGNNGIVVRGNAPQMLAWKMEGIEIPNPNHFADMSVFGGGGLTALSSQMLSNSDFYTGAFPAEYGNATSGVFDIYMRNGKTGQREYTFQAGGIGIDLSAEGPFKNNGNSSYLFNYRYSTLALLTPLLPEDADETTYQDLAFKCHFPTKKTGSFSLWGLGLIDGSGTNAESNPDDWYYQQDKEDSDVKQGMGTIGLTHKYYLGEKTLMQSSLATTSRYLNYFVDEMDNDKTPQHREKIKATDWNIILSSNINHKFGKSHQNKTGFVITNLNYDMLFRNAFTLGEPMQTLVDNKGTSFLLSAYSSSKIQLSPKLNGVFGFHTQLFTLNNNYTFEPRISILWQISDIQSVGFAYGKHSRLERLNIYFALDDEENLVNRNLDFMHAHHFVFSYDLNTGENSRLKIEPYFQWLNNVPVEPGSYFSTLNLQNDWYVNSPLINEGKGKNYGVDLTFERFLNRGYYYLFTSSLFESKYKDGNAIWRNTRYNKNYVINALGGKEWQLGHSKQNLLNVNARVTFQNGERYIPVDYVASGNSGDIIYEYDRAFEESLDPVLFLHITLNYIRNKPRHTSIWAINIINATGAKEFYGFRRNYKTGQIEPEMEAIIIPNISYKIEF